MQLSVLSFRFGPIGLGVKERSGTTKVSPDVGEHILDPGAVRA